MRSWCAHLPVEDNAPDEAQGQLVVPIHNVRTANVDQINLKVWQIGHGVNVPAYEQQQRILKKSLFAIMVKHFVFIEVSRFGKNKVKQVQNDYRSRWQRNKTEYEVKSQVRRWTVLNLLQLPIISELRQCRHLFCLPIYMCEAAAESAHIQVSERELSALELEKTLGLGQWTGTDIRRKSAMLVTSPRADFQSITHSWRGDWSAKKNIYIYY